MTSISHSAAPADVRAAPQAKTRNAALDRARTFLTLVVLLHHAVIPYTYFGHTDPKFFIGFDMIVLATDSFFMAMFFLLSGLFVWSGLARKGPLHYLLDRLIRLGLPFAICAFTVIPVAYYAISLRQHPEVLSSQFAHIDARKNRLVEYAARVLAQHPQFADDPDAETTANIVLALCASAVRAAVDDWAQSTSPTTNPTDETDENAAVEARAVELVRTTLRRLA